LAYLAFLKQVNELTIPFAPQLDAVQAAAVVYCEGNFAGLDGKTAHGLVRFFAVVCSYSEKPSCLPPITPVQALIDAPILAQSACVFQSLLSSMILTDRSSHQSLPFD
jgi:hypothetical protein